jgi:hypothetical protein
VIGVGDRSIGGLSAEKINFYCSPIVPHSTIPDIRPASCLNPSLLQNPFIFDVHANELSSSIEINSTKKQFIFGKGRMEFLKLVLAMNFPYLRHVSFILE